MEIWETKPPGTLWATPGLLRDPFTFTFTFFTQSVKLVGQSLNTFFKIQQLLCLALAVEDVADWWVSLIAVINLRVL